MENGFGELAGLRLRIKRMERSPYHVNAVLRDSPADVADLVGAQVALVPDDVWHRLGSRLSVAARGIGRGFPLRQPPGAEFAGRRHHVHLSRTSACGRRQHELWPTVFPDLSRLPGHPA